MLKLKSIKKNRDFSRVYNCGQKSVGRYMVLFWFKNDLGYNRYGIVASKKLGNAVIRNRCRRRIRIMVRDFDSLANQGYDVILVARNGLVNSLFTDLVVDFRRLMKRAGLCE